MVGCSVVKCSNRSSRKKEQTAKPRISFHRFPHDPQIYKAWVNAVRRENWTPSKESVICSEHFTNDCFDSSDFQRRLVKHAIPTIFPDIYLRQVLDQKESESLPLSEISIELHSSESMDVDTFVTPGTSGTSKTFFNDETSISNQSHIDKKKSVRHLISRTTSFSPERRRHRALSPSTQLLKNKYKYKQNIYIKKIKLLQQQSRRHVKRIATLKNVLTELKKKNFINEEFSNSLSNICGPNQDVLKRQICKEKGKATTRTYSPMLRKFALNLHYFSPAAYNYVRKSFNSVLPHPKTISKWYRVYNGTPGFTIESFHAIKIKQQYTDYPLLFSLIIDETAIRKHIEFDGQNYHGYVQLGTEGSDKEAKEAFVFLLVAINQRWKIPVGYFFSDGITGEQKCNLLKQCICIAREHNINIVSVTFDGYSSNFSMARLLGCKIDPIQGVIPWFICEENGPDNKIYIFPDPSHMLKLVRNIFGDTKYIYTENNEIILWEYLEKLNDLQKNEGLHLGNKLGNQHINFKTQKMKVKLAAQLFSQSVADSLKVCLHLKLSDFIGCEATIDFIERINKLFDIFNSRSMKQFGIKQPLNGTNYLEVMEFLEEMKQYLKGLRISVDGPSVITTKKKTGFIGFLICIESLQQFYLDICINRKNLVYIPTYKISQDHIEILFGTIRAHGKTNNNPTARQFTAAYKKILAFHELQDDSRGNCIPLEEICILHVSSAVEAINATSGRQKLSKEDEVFEEDILEDGYLDNTDMTEFSENIVVYIAGYVARKISYIINCDTCIKALFTDDTTENYYSLINIKNKGGLVYPSNDVIQICKKSEHILRGLLKKDDTKIFQSKNSKLKLSNTVLQHFLNTNIFSSLLYHMFEQEPTENHAIFLIKAVIEEFYKIRYHYLAKRKMDQIVKTRNFHNRLILLRGQ